MIARAAAAPGIPRSPLARRIDAWISTRTPRVPGPWTIGRRRIYIVPTRYGYGYALLLFVMLLGAMNYSNSMAFALTFLLAGMGLLAMHYTHGNLVNLRVQAERVPPVFAGEPARFSVKLENPSQAPRYALSAQWRADRKAAKTVQVVATVDVPSGTAEALTLNVETSQRGWLPAPRFAVSTDFPVGLFHAWTWVELDMNCLVYPRPGAPRPHPDTAGDASGAHGGQRAGQEEFAGLRTYQRGDALRSIHWKSFAKSRTPMVKQFADALDEALWLDWSSLPLAWDAEQRLSQLTRWVIDADAEGRAYGLRLPGTVREPDSGEAHRHACLMALALHR